MAKQVKVPFVGSVDRNWLFIGGGGTAALIGVLWWRNHQKQKAQQASMATPQAVYVAGQTGVDPAGNTGVIDPETGYVYNSPEDQSALGDAAIPYYSGANLYTPSQYTPDTSYGQRGSGGGSGGSGSGGSHSRYKNNAEWLQAAVRAMPEFDKDTVEKALTKVLAGETVTTEQRNLFLDAVGLVGQPPDGYPKPIHTSDTAAQPGGGGGDHGGGSGGGSGGGPPPRNPPPREHREPPKRTREGHEPTIRRRVRA